MVSGVPRVINIICDIELSCAFAVEIPIIDKVYLEEVLRDQSEGGFPALGQDPLRQLGEEAFVATDFDKLFGCGRHESSKDVV